MTEIEKKALALVNEVRVERGYSDAQTYPATRTFPPFEALCRAIEQHETFRQEVSDAVESRWATLCSARCGDVFASFIITKPDPLVEALREAAPKSRVDTHEQVADNLRIAIEKRGGKIVWGDE